MTIGFYAPLWGRVEPLDRFLRDHRGFHMFNMHAQKQVNVADELRHLIPWSMR